MKTSTKSSSTIYLQFFAKMQEAVSKIAYPAEDRLNRVELVCAVDASGNRDLTASAAVVYSLSRREVVESAVRIIKGEPAPYIPGFLALREAPAMFEALTVVGGDVDVVLVDGHGRAHPRRCGLATLLGFVAEKPSIGVAKSLLIGVKRPVDEFYEVVIDEEVVGLTRGKIVYSQGYGVSFGDLMKVFRLFEGKYPPPLVHADKLSREAVKQR